MCICFTLVWPGMPAVDMWRPLGCADSERFALVWESEELKALNNTLFSFVKNKVGQPSAELRMLAPCSYTRKQDDLGMAMPCSLNCAAGYRIDFWVSKPQLVDNASG